MRRRLLSPFRAQLGIPGKMHVSNGQEGIGAAVLGDIDGGGNVDLICANGRIGDTTADEIRGKRSLVSFFEAAHEALDDLGGDALSNRYFNLLATFIIKFSLRYDLRRPCTLCPTLTGVFASLVRDLRALTSQEAHPEGLMKDFEETVRDLRLDCGDRRIKTCIHADVVYRGVR